MEFPIKTKIQVSNTGFTSTDRIRTYEVTTKGYFTKFKLLMTSENDGGTKDLKIYEIDVFGTIYSFFHQELNNNRKSIHIFH